ncbi:MAG: hypothetical protein M1814_000987 [Vezdaea aestivalis]|nr:MAG: hypothetical protein M1814_000987 [Vezdaea aestivalis]
MSPSVRIETSREAREAYNKRSWDYVDPVKARRDARHLELRDRAEKEWDKDKKSKVREEKKLEKEQTARENRKNGIFPERQKGQLDLSRFLFTVFPAKQTGGTAKRKENSDGMSLHVGDGSNGAKRQRTEWENVTKRKDDMEKLE